LTPRDVHGGRRQGARIAHPKTDTASADYLLPTAEVTMPGGASGAMAGGETPVRYKVSAVSSLT